MFNSMGIYVRRRQKYVEMKTLHYSRPLSRGSKSFR